MARRTYGRSKNEVDLYKDYDAFYTMDNMEDGFKNRVEGSQIGDALTLPQASQVSEKGTFFPFSMRSKGGVVLPIKLVPDYSKAGQSRLELDIYTDISKMPGGNTGVDREWDRYLFCQGSETAWWLYGLQCCFISNLSDYIVTQVPGRAYGISYFNGNGISIPYSTSGGWGITQADLLNLAWSHLILDLTWTASGNYGISYTLEKEDGTSLYTKWKDIGMNLQDYERLIIGNNGTGDGDVSDEYLWNRNAAFRYITNVRFKYEAL